LSFDNSLNFNTSIGLEGLPLLDEHGLQPSELPELGNPEEVLDLLGGTESLNLAQIRALSHRFRVSPAVFV